MTRRLLKMPDQALGLAHAHRLAPKQVRVDSIENQRPILLKLRVGTQEPGVKKPAVVRTRIVEIANHGGEPGGVECTESALHARSTNLFWILFAIGLLSRVCSVGLTIQITVSDPPRVKNAVDLLVSHLHWCLVSCYDMLCSEWGSCRWWQ